MFQETQDDEYLETIVQRMKMEDLIWVEQFLDIIVKHINLDQKKKLNDIGCNAGQFYKGLKKRGLNIGYKGYDIEPIYLKLAKSLFPELKNSFLSLDISKDLPQESDISVVSATLEHLEFLSPGLDNILRTTKKLAIIRSFLGEHFDKSVFKKDTAKTHYYINQYSFVETLSLCEKYGFKAQVMRDKYTDSMPKYIGQGIVRTQYVIIAEK